MVTEEQYKEAAAQKDAAQQTINQYFKEKQQAFDEKIANNHIWADDELVYSANQLCPCGHGLAYPKDCGPNHYWDCSAILKGIGDKSVEHAAQYPFAFYDIKSESEYRGTTRGVFRPKPA